MGHLRTEATYYLIDVLEIYDIYEPARGNRLLTAFNVASYRLCIKDVSSEHVANHTTAETETG